MRKFIFIAVFLLSGSAFAQQQPVNTSIFSGLPPAGTITGNELVPLDQNGTTKKATTSQLTLGSMVLGIPSGGTGLTTLGPANSCLCSTGSALSYQTVGGGGGGGTPASGFTSSVIVTSGSTATAICGEFVVFDSASGSAKTLNIPTSTGVVQANGVFCHIGYADAFGDAYTANITPVPASGGISGQAAVYTNKGEGEVTDSAFGWVAE